MRLAILGGHRLGTSVRKGFESLESHANLACASSRKKSSLSIDKAAKKGLPRVTRQRRGIGAPVRTDGRKAILEQAARQWLEKHGMTVPDESAPPAGTGSGTKSERDR